LIRVKGAAVIVALDWALILSKLNIPGLLVCLVGLVLLILAWVTRVSFSNLSIERSALHDQQPILTLTIGVLGMGMVLAGAILQFPLRMDPLLLLLLVPVGVSVFAAAWSCPVSVDG
jgi:hypothetical protein